MVSLSSREFPYTDSFAAQIKGCTGPEREQSNKRKDVKTIQKERHEVYIGLCFYANVLVRKGIHLGSNKEEGGGKLRADLSTKKHRGFLCRWGI